MFFLAPALPYLGAGIAGLGAAARAAGSPQGQRFLQGGINTLNRFGTRLQDFLQPASQMITQQAIQRPISAGTVIPFASIIAKSVIIHSGLFSEINKQRSFFSMDRLNSSDSFKIFK